MNRSIIIFSLLLFIVLAVPLNIFSQQALQIDDHENYAKVANSYFQQNQWEEGKKVVDAGLKKYPKDSDLRMLLGKYYYAHKEYDKARYELVEALIYNKNNVAAKQILVNVETITQRYSSAICYINELLEINPYWKGLWQKKMEVYRLQGNTIEANRMLKRLYQIYPQDKSIQASYLYYIEEEALRKQNQGQIKEVINLTETLLEQNPANEDYYLQLINGYLKSGDYGTALIYAERGVYNIPGSIPLIDKKADILSYLYRYDELVDFLKLKINEGHNVEHLRKRYSYYLQEAARSRRKSDPYSLYSNVFDQNPQNQEAFNYVLNTALWKGLYEDALDAISKAKKAKGETKELLLWEQLVYERMGSQSKADQLTIRLWEMFPDDYDIAYRYTLYRFRQGKSLMTDGFYEKALSHWQFVAQHGEPDEVNTALIALYNCNYQLGRHDDALAALEKLIEAFPAEWEWRAKRATIYGELERYDEAAGEYETILQSVPAIDRRRALNGYEELAAIHVKALIEEYRMVEAIALIDRWLQTDPHNELALRYAINISAQMNDYEKVKSYALAGLNADPGNAHYRMKLAEAHNTLKNHDHSIEILQAEVEKNPHHKTMINTYSQAVQDYAFQMIKDSEPQKALTQINNALQYDPANKELKYAKGVAFEKLHRYDSAYHYQMFYEPALMEYKGHSKHIQYLKSRTYKNKIGMYFLWSRYGDVDAISSIATIEYTRFTEKNTFAFRFNYAGRDTGKGIQGQAEWERGWNNTFRSSLELSAANKILPSFGARASLYKLFKRDWEVELGAGYRRLAEKDNLFNVVAGLSKEWEACRINPRLNSVILDGKWYYSVSAQMRLYMGHPRTYITAMGSFGSAPDIDVIDYQLYQAFSVTNSMVGLGGHYMVSDKLSLALLGNWYNFKQEENLYRDFYNVYVQLHVNF